MNHSGWFLRDVIDDQPAIPYRVSRAGRFEGRRQQRPDRPRLGARDVRSGGRARGSRARNADAARSLGSSRQEAGTMRLNSFRTRSSPRRDSDRLRKGERSVRPTPSPVLHAAVAPSARWIRAAAGWALLVVAVLITPVGAAEPAHEGWDAGNLNGWQSNLGAALSVPASGGNPNGYLLSENASADDAVIHTGPWIGDYGAAGSPGSSSTSSSRVRRASRCRDSRSERSARRRAGSIPCRAWWRTMSGARTPSPSTRRGATPKRRPTVG